MKPKAVPVPACFDSEEQFVQWRSFDLLCHHPIVPCHDCTQEYQRKMMQEGRCEHPEYRVGRQYGAETVGERRTMADEMLEKAKQLRRFSTKQLADSTGARPRTVRSWLARAKLKGLVDSTCRYPFEWECKDER